MRDRRMMARTADQDESFNHKGHKETRSLIFVSLFIWMSIHKYRRRMKLQEVTSEERFPTVAFLVFLCVLYG